MKTNDISSGLVGDRTSPAFTGAENVRYFCVSDPCARVRSCVPCVTRLPPEPGVFLPVPKSEMLRSESVNFVRGVPPRAHHTTVSRHRLKGRLRSPRSTQVLSTRSNPRIGRGKFREFPVLAPGPATRIITYFL